MRSAQYYNGWHRCLLAASVGVLLEALRVVTNRRRAINLDWLLLLDHKGTNEIDERTLTRIGYYLLRKLGGVIHASV